MDAVQLVAIVVSGGLLVAVLELVRVRRLSQEYSLIWILCALALLVLAVARRQLDAVALWLGIFYPPALLILMVIFIVFVVSLYFSLAISRQGEQIERLIEEVALIAARQREEASPHRNTPALEDSAAPTIPQVGRPQSGRLSPVTPGAAKDRA